MRFATLRHNGTEQAAILVDDRWVPLDLVDQGLVGNLLVLISRRWPAQRLAELKEVAARVAPAGTVLQTDARFGPPFRRPHKIWGIGLNYREHALDLKETQPAEPASFLKGDHTIVGGGDHLLIPLQSRRVTSEAELGLVFGRQCHQVSEDDALDHLFGVCNVLDQTAEDILAENPRYLTRAKNFPTFFSFGPEVLTLDEFLIERRLEEVTVATVRDGATVAVNTVGNMAHSPSRLISFHSQVMPFFPGDVLSTGTPGAALVTHGAIMQCRIEGLTPLVNPVQGPR